jgi:sensor histidine kinase YesM
MDIVFKQPAQLNITLPPMLLMPFIENLFKHGIDKDKKDNYAYICLEISNDMLIFSVTNALHSNLEKTESGIGLKNLQKRLRVLYGKNFTLHAVVKGDQYESRLIIPVE